MENVSMVSSPEKAKEQCLVLLVLKTVFLRVEARPSHLAERWGWRRGLTGRIRFGDQKAEPGRSHFLTT